MPTHHSADVPFTLNSTSPQRGRAAYRVDVVDIARDLGVIIDSQLSFSAQAAALSRSGDFELRQLRPIIHSLTMEAAKTIAQAFISCRLDYCTSLIYDISDSLIQCLQSVQNAVAGLVTLVLRQLHWLPVCQRKKIAGWVFQALTGQAPAYLADDCRLISDSDRRRLRSSDIRTCVTPRTSIRDSVTEVFHLLVLKLGTVYRLHSGLRT